MADKKTILTLNLGSQRISLARFILGNKGALTLRDLAFEELPGDVTNDVTRKSLVSAAVKALAKKLKAADEEVIYAIPSQNVITRPVKLPALGEEQVDKIVGFEAQQAVPFPLTETVWDYQILNSDGPESEVLIAAIRAEQLDELNAAVEATGMKPLLADAAPFALYNSYIFTHGYPEQTTLLLDMGARTTDAIFMEGEKVFITSFPNAGAHVSQAISREMSAEYEDAEARKKEAGFVNLGGNFADHEDPEVDAMSKIIRNQFTRLHAEVNRRVQMYRQQGGSAPTHILLAGGASGMPYTKEFFEEKFRIPVEWYNALGNVSVGPKVNAEEAGANGHSVGELVGLALRYSGKKQPLHLDLSPKSVDAAKDLKSRKPKLFVAAALLFAALGTYWAWNVSATGTKEAQLKKVEKELNGLKVFDNKITAEQTREKKEKARLNHLENALSGRQYLLKLLDTLNQQFTNNLMWLTEIQPLDESGKRLTKPLIGTEDSITLLGLTDAELRRAKPNEGTDAVIDGIYISGLFRGDSQDIVKELYEKFKALPDLFIFPEDWEKNRGRYLNVNYAGAETRWASSFEMFIKLKNPQKITLLPEKF